MTGRTLSGLFVGEGSSDAPLAELVELLFLDRGVDLDLSTPDFARLANRVGSALDKKLPAGLELVRKPVDLIVVHRDCDTVRPEDRLREMREALEHVGSTATLLPVIPVRMTEAWLLLDECAIRTVAGNPNGRNPLDLPAPREVERRADPKGILRKALLDASATTGRRRASIDRRFPSHRKALLEGLDRFGPVTGLESWKDLVTGVEGVVRGSR